MESLNIMNTIEEKPDQYRFEHGSLYELQENSYIHVFKRAGISTKHDAIAAYLESELDDSEQ